MQRINLQNRNPSYLCPNISPSFSLAESSWNSSRERINVSTLLSLLSVVIINVSERLAPSSVDIKMQSVSSRFSSTIMFSSILLRFDVVVAINNYDSFCERKSMSMKVWYISLNEFQFYHLFASDSLYSVALQTSVLLGSNPFRKNTQNTQNTQYTMEC